MSGHYRVFSPGGHILELNPLTRLNTTFCILCDENFVYVKLIANVINCPLSLYTPQYVKIQKIKYLNEYSTSCPAFTQPPLFGPTNEKERIFGFPK